MHKVLPQRWSLSTAGRNIQRRKTKHMRYIPVRPLWFEHHFCFQHDFLIPTTLLMFSTCFCCSKSEGTHGTTQPMGAAVMKKEAYGTFGRPVEALPNDPVNFLKQGARTVTGRVAENDGATKGPLFKYPGRR